MKASKGFTLVEVLIAFVILVAVVAGVSSAYRSAVLSNIKAATSVEFDALVPLLSSTIQSRLRLDADTVPIQQEGVLNDTLFRWQAVVIEKGSAPPRYSVEDDAWQTFRERFYLWQVDLVLEKNGRTREYRFHQLTWKQ